MSTATDLRNLLAAGVDLTIVCHKNPDPDCPASAFALGRIAVDAGVDEHRIVYSGDISHQQNRAFVNLLDIDLHPFDPASGEDRPHGSLLAVVDNSPPGAPNRVPEGTRVDIVVDHQPADEIAGRIVDHRSAVGATATILTGYVQTLGIEVDAALATALLLAIRRETLGFLRGATRRRTAQRATSTNTPTWISSGSCPRPRSAA